jgi:hypothetical protein
VTKPPKPGFVGFDSIHWGVIRKFLAGIDAECIGFWLTTGIWCQQGTIEFNVWVLFWKLGRGGCLRLAVNFLGTQELI